MTRRQTLEPPALKQVRSTTSSNPEICPGIFTGYLAIAYGNPLIHVYCLPEDKYSLPASCRLPQDAGGCSGYAKFMVQFVCRQWVAFYCDWWLKDIRSHSHIVTKITGPNYGITSIKCRLSLLIFPSLPGIMLERSLLLVANPFSLHAHLKRLIPRSLCGHIINSLS